MEILIKIFQLLLSLSILVIVHEFGHFIAARIFHTRVEKFYLFFNPWFSLFKFNYKGTEYGIGWLPLGGYVKIAGMIDESLDKESMAQPPQPWEFRSKPAWQRLIIMLGGVIMNVVLAFVIYIGMLTAYGEQYLPTAEVNRYGIATDSLGRSFGLVNGDRILAVDGNKVADFNKIPLTIILEKARTLTIERDGETITLELPEGAIGQLVKHQSPLFLSARIPFVVQGFPETSPARDAGVLPGDTLLSINGQEARYFQDFRELIQQYRNQEISLGLKRGNDTLQLTVMVPEAGLIGVFPVQRLDAFFNLAQKDFTLFSAIPAGMEKTIDGISGYLKQLKLIVSPEVKAYENVGGFIAIGNIFPAEFHWESFWRLTAFLSIMLAVLNLLPIPALDGGHVTFLMYEIIARRKPSDKFMEVAQIMGMALLLALMIYANGNDIVKLFR
ncbi:MAG TPA: RIP metalloprotease RseP [Bacteroidales bacterium]|nr:RIP metalloprotease RseP [Bacteroidales bacterium]